VFRDKARAQRLARSALPGVFGVVVVPGLKYLWLFSPERRGFHNSFLMFDNAIRLITLGALPPARVCRGQTGRQTSLLQRADAFSPAPAGIRVISAGIHARAGVNSASPTPDSDED
jgi:hypothetical protein